MALKFFHAIRLFGQFVQEGLVSSGEVARFWKLIEAKCQENEEDTFNLCKMLQETRSWDDKSLCRELRISVEALKDLENRQKPSSAETVGLRMLYKLFPQMAV